MYYVPLVLFSSTMIWHHTYKYTHFFQPFPLYGKNLKPPFLENFKNSTPTPPLTIPYMKDGGQRGGGSSYVSQWKSKKPNSFWLQLHKVVWGRKKQMHLPFLRSSFSLSHRCYSSSKNKLAPFSERVDCSTQLYCK